MECKTAEKLLDKYLDGRLSNEDRERVEDHCAACPACRERLTELTLLQEAARTEFPSSPSLSYWRRQRRDVRKKISSLAEEEATGNSWTMDLRDILWPRSLPRRFIRVAAGLALIFMVVRLAVLEKGTLPYYLTRSGPQGKALEYREIPTDKKEGKGRVEAAAPTKAATQDEDRLEETSGKGAESVASRDQNRILIGGVSPAEEKQAAEMENPLPSAPSEQKITAQEAETLPVRPSRVAGAETLPQTPLLKAAAASPSLTLTPAEWQDLWRGPDASGVLKMKMIDASRNDMLQVPDSLHASLPPTSRIDQMIPILEQNLTVYPAEEGETGRILLLGRLYFLRAEKDGDTTHMRRALDYYNIHQSILVRDPNLAARAEKFHSLLYGTGTKKK